MTTSYNRVFDLLSNGSDSIRHALEHYCYDPNETRKYKYTILHLAQGLNLLLKERLRREHESLVYTRVEELSKHDAKTVDVKDLLVRLEKIAQVSLDFDKEFILQLAELRNTIEHYSFSINPKQADRIIAHTVTFTTRFCSQELNSSLRDTVGADTWLKLIETRSFAIEAAKACEKRISSEMAEAIKCPRCSAQTARITYYNRPETETSYKLATCDVCTDMVQLSTKCRNCGIEVINKHQVLVNRHYEVSPVLSEYTYCESCRSLLKAKYPQIVVPEIAAEIKKYCSIHGTATTEVMLKLINNACSAGPLSKHNHLIGLLRMGYIDFEDPVDKEATEIYRRAYPYQFAPANIRFKWVNS